MSEPPFSDPSLSPKSSDYLKLTSKIGIDLANLNSIAFPYCSIINEKMKSSLEEHNTTVSINEDLTIKAEQMKRSISESESELASLSHKTESMIENIKNEISTLCMLKEAEISSLQDEILYKSDLIAFLQRLTSIEIDEGSSRVTAKAFGNEMSFLIGEEDDSNFSFQLQNFSREIESLPDWAQQHISFSKSQCLTLFLSIYEILNSSN